MCLHSSTVYITICLFCISVLKSNMFCGNLVWISTVLKCSNDYTVIICSREVYLNVAKESRYRDKKKNQYLFNYLLIFALSVNGSLVDRRVSNDKEKLSAWMRL